MDSADQDAWVELAQLLREGIRKRLAHTHMAIMEADDIKTLVEAAREAQSLAFTAATFDRDVELKNSRSAWPERS